MNKTFLSEFKGQKITCVCARYQYWGVLSEIIELPNKDLAIVLAMAEAVGESGANDSEKPERTDPLNGSVTIMVGAIECIAQPKWSQSKLSAEK